MADRILVLEDETNVGSTLSERLSQEGFDVIWARSIEDAILEIKGRRFDLALVDVGLPDGSGFQFADTFRKDQRQAALIFLTAFGNPEDRVRGLELGAEDYIVKPFHLKELILRVKNALRRAKYFAGLSGTQLESVQVGRARVDFSKFSAEADGKTYSLTHKECEFFKLLIDRKGRVVSRDEILTHIWSEQEFPNPRTVDNFILKLRKIVEKDPENPSIIRSIRGIGYMIEEETKS